MKSIFVFSCTLIFAQHVTAQQSVPFVIASGGDYFTATSFTNSFTVGEESAVTTSSNGTFILTQGFQQPQEGPNAVLDPQAVTGFNAYPNPTAGMLTLNYVLAAAGQVQLEVYDLSGKLLQAETQQQQAGRQHEVLDLSGLSNGAYFINIRIGGRAVTVNRIHIVH